MTNPLMLWLYRILFPLVSLGLMPYYLWRMRRRGGYRQNFGDRFGGIRRLRPKPAGVRRVWLQAVSVGEMLAIAPILEALRQDGAEVFLTTTTSTGFRLARERYRGLAMGIGYFPIDWWPFSARAWRRIAPDLVILTEGERWPEHARQARNRGIPVININARLSDRSFRRLRSLRRWLPAVPRFLLADITRLLPCSSQDEARFRELGAAPERILTTGNIKLDVSIPRLGEIARSELRRELGLPASLILLGSSTWPGEEESLVEALQAARASGLRCALLLVPRHAERRGEIEQALRRTGLRTHFRTSGTAKAEVDVAVADTTGELRQLIQLSDLVFVGKSLAPYTEGQTPVEAAVLEKPMIFGPGMGNFSAIARDLVSRGAARQIPDAGSLATEVRELLGNPGRRAQLAAAAAAWHRDNGGAVERTLAVIRAELAILQVPPPAPRPASGSAGQN